MEKKRKKAILERVIYIRVLQAGVLRESATADSGWRNIRADARSSYTLRVL